VGALSSPQPEKLSLSNADLARWQQAQQLIASGRAPQALPAYLSLVKSAPAVASLWFECGVAAIAAVEFDTARRAFAQARQLAPGNAQLLNALAQQYHRLRQPADARACFQQAAAADPHSVHAALSLAAWLEREHDLDGAWQCCEEVLARHPGDPNALYYRAFLLHRKGQGAEAESLLRAIGKMDFTDPNLRISCRHLLGVVLDELGRYDEALACLAESKNAIRASANVAAFEQAYEKAERARRQLLADLTPQMISRWRQDTPAPPQTLALLGGHPRSGTTLLEQILGAHPDVAAFDESEAFATQIWDQLAPASAPTCSAQSLHSLSPSRCSSMRAGYFRSLFRELEAAPAGKVLIDKNPGPTAALPFWLRLFPASKIIIALRDPRDVVISCYFQQLTLTPTNVNFLSLERAAKHFGDLMDVWLRMRELGGFDWIETRYEDFVANLEAEGRRVTEFLGLAWHPGQARCHEAASRKLVFSPTYNDVTKPAHNRAIGRWRHYQSALEPALSRLAPYFDKRTT